MSTYTCSHDQERQGESSGAKVTVPFEDVQFGFDEEQCARGSDDIGDGGASSRNVRTPVLATASQTLMTSRDLLCELKQDTDSTRTTLAQTNRKLEDANRGIQAIQADHGPSMQQLPQIKHTMGIMHSEIQNSGALLNQVHQTGSEIKAELIRFSDKTELEFRTLSTIENVLQQNFEAQRLREHQQVSKSID